MDSTVLINKRVRVWIEFGAGDFRDSLCLPRRMLYRGRYYDFSELGLRHPTRKGQRMIHVFDMSDGSADYRLEFDAEHLTWELVSISDNYAVA